MKKKVQKPLLEYEFLLLGKSKFMKVQIQYHLRIQSL